MSEASTVFVVDDDPGAALSLRWLLEAEGLAVEAYSSAREFLNAYDPQRPGCLVLDLCMPEVDGLELQQRLLARGAPPPIIFVSAHGDVPKCAAAMKAGAVDFLEKPVHHERILALIRRALEQDRQNRQVALTGPEIAARINRLTPRERDVMRLLFEGKAIKAIAVHFGTGFQTAAKHRTRVLDKLHVQNEAELVRLLINFPLA